MSSSLPRCIAACLGFTTNDTADDDNEKASIQSYKDDDDIPYQPPDHRPQTTYEVTIKPIDPGQQGVFLRGVFHGRSTLSDAMSRWLSSGTLEETRAFATPLISGQSRPHTVTLDLRGLDKETLEGWFHLVRSGAPCDVVQETAGSMGFEETDATQTGHLL